jgi:D-methionine transport system substrate-binding protein
MRITLRSARLAGAAAAVAVLSIGLSACASSAPATNPDVENLGTLKVGALQTPAGDILTWVQENLAADAGLTIEFVPFTDYNTPNLSVSDGSTDANLFQNANFLKTYNDSSDDSLVSVGDVYLPSAAFYSDKVDSLDDLEDGAKIAVPNDPTNEGRALKILAAEGLIETTDEPTTLGDITENKRDFEFVEIENATLAQSVPDVDTAFVTISFALPAGLTADDAILVEGSDSPYVNVLATTEKLKSDPRVEKLLELLTSDETAEYIDDTWGGLVVPVK